MKEKVTPKKNFSNEQHIHIYLNMIQNINLDDSMKKIKNLRNLKKKKKKQATLHI